MPEEPVTEETTTVSAEATQPAETAQPAETIQPVETAQPVETTQPAETEPQQVTLTNITWKLNAEESDGDKFDSSKKSEGKCYVYEPVLPETDENGNKISVAEDAELPQIYVLIGGRKVRTLSNEVMDIADIETQNTNGQIIINQDNLEDWDNKILTGSVTSSDLNDGAKGLVIDGVTLNLTIRDLTIDRRNFMSNSISAISLTNQAVLNLTLEGDNSLYGAYGGAGIGVPEGTVLCITGKSSGSLYAKGGNMYGGAAGIGAISPGLDLNYSSSPQTRSCGYIEIAGGNVKAEGGTYRFRGSDVSGGAGIGGSYGACGGMINITGGSVTAIGGMYGAGIGGGNGSVATITISGGTVVAEGTGKGARQPAAIGRGVDMETSSDNVMPCGKITLDGGNVTAKGNIGYGYVDSGYYPSGDNAEVTVSDQVFLTLDGEIKGGNSNKVKNYELSFTVFDTAFTNDRTANVALDGSLVQEKIAAKMTMPGQVAFTLSFAHNVFSGEKTFTVTIDGKTYEATADFEESQTEYDLTAGKELYPVSLEFYDDAITENVAVDEISVKQNGTALNSTEFVHPGSIERVNSGIGKMMIFLPADENTTDITVKASGINGSKEMTKTGLTIGKTGITTVSMCGGKVTLSAKTSKVNATDVTLAVESNVMTWDLYIKQSNDQVIADPEEIISKGTVYTQTAQKGEVHLENLKKNHNYGYYMVAKQGELVSEIVPVYFNTPNGAIVFWENNSSIDKKYYEGFFNAISNAETISPDGFTIQAQGNDNGIGWLALKKSCKLDLNGQNVSINGTKQCSLALAEGVSAVLTDSAGSAEYHNSSSGGSYSFFYMASNSSLTIQGGSYYDYKELLRAQSSETQTGRTLTIEGGSFHGGNHIDIGDGKVVLSGGTFYGGLSVNGSCEIKDGYAVKYLTGSNKGTYTTTLPAKGDDIEIVPLPELRGNLELKIGNGFSSAGVGETLTATFTDKDGNGNGNYIYKWYCVDGDTETVAQTSSETLAKESTYMLKQEDIGKQFYCEVTKSGTSGSIKSEKTYSVLGYSLDGVVITLQKGTWRYDGTEQKPKVTSVVKPDGGRISEGTSYKVSYENNIHAGTAKVIITGVGVYSGRTAETTFTIGQKAYYDDLKIEGVEDSYEYTGKEICPEIVVKDGAQVIPKSQYTVSYENNKNLGTATVRITGKDDGDYYFGENYNHKSFAITHDHDWTYKVNSWTIRMECKNYPCPQGLGTLKLEVNDADTLKYNGKTQDVAAILQYPSGIYPESKIKKEYSGDGLENGLPKNAGSYTAIMSVEEGGETYTATLKFEIQKADTQIGTVTADVLENTLDVDQVQLSRTDTTIPGTLKLKEGTVLQYGTHDYQWVFEPEDSVNYETLDGTVSITVKDTIAPSASWKIGESIWRKFVNKISFGYLCKNTETMKITFEDAESGVATKQYYIADQEITDFSGVEWTDYTAPVVLPLGPVRIVYVRVTDNVGNTSILNSDGLTVYQESALKTDAFSYTYKEGHSRELYVKLNGNIFAEVLDDGGQTLDRNMDYEFDDPFGRLTLSSRHLNGLSVGTHTYKIKLYPQGRQEAGTIAYNFSIIVEKAKLYVVDASVEGKTYDGSSLVNVTGITLGRVDGYPYEPGPSVDINNMQGTLEKADAGTYQSVTLPTLTLTGSDVDSYELVQPDGPVYLLPSVTVSKKAAPVIQTTEKSYVYVKDVVEAIDLTEFLPADCGEAVFGKPNHGSRGYEYYKVAPSVNGGILSYTAGKTTWEQLQNDKRGELVVPVQMTNYEDTEIKFTLRLHDQTNVVLKQGMEVRLKNNVLTYGEPLSKMIFEDAVFTDEAGNVIEGTFGWPDGTWVPYAGITVGTWQFKPADAEYKSVYGSVDIVVNQATPTIETPAIVAERAYDPTKALEDSNLTGGVVRGADGTVLDGTWSWKQSGIVPTMNNSGYEAVFTPSDTNNYTTVGTTVAVKVKKAEPVIVQNPVASEITWGESLADSVLKGGSAQHGVTGAAVSGTFAWKDATIKPNVADSNQTAYTVVFTPEDTEHYETTEVTVTLNIKQAGNTPNLPGSQMNVSYICKTVKAAKLPDGWAWDEADQDKELMVGTAVDATAVYIGEGHGNYETERVVIAITRLACKHPDTEVKNATAASYGKNGYSGDTVCKDCGTVLKTGSPIAAFTHDQTTVIVKTGTEVRLKNNTLTYGEPLSKLKFEDAVFTDEAGNVIDGKLGWADDTWKPLAGTTEGNWEFKPTDAKYRTVCGTVEIVVNKAKPVVETPAAVSERTWNPAKTLADSDLNGIKVTGIDGVVLDGAWSWKKSGIIPEVKNSGYEAVFTPDDLHNYETVDTTVAVKVNKAVPVIVQKPTASEITWGESLTNSVLSGGKVKVQHEGFADVVLKGSFAWKDGTIRPNVADSNQTAYTVVFTPEDTEHYETTEVTVTLNIKQTGNTPNLPGDPVAAFTQNYRDTYAKEPAGYTDSAGGGSSTGSAMGIGSGNPAGPEAENNGDSGTNGGEDDVAGGTADGQNGTTNNQNGGAQPDANRSENSGHLSVPLLAIGGIGIAAAGGTGTALLIRKRRKCGRK